MGGNFKLPFILVPIATFILLPIALLLHINMHGKLAKKYEWDIEEKPLSLYYFLFLFVTGTFHTILGLLFVFIVPPLLLDAVDLIFPYVTYDTVTFITILGWINLIPGLILFFSSFWAKKFSDNLEKENISKDLLAIRSLIIIASIFLLIVFPIGTFFAIALILEFFHYAKDKT
jgi:hypothetical protein